MREPTEMELRVAGLIAKTCHWVPIEDDAENSGTRLLALALARAAICAMREPTRDIVEAAKWYDEALEAWPLMIDAASPPE